MRTRSGSHHAPAQVLSEGGDVLLASCTKRRQPPVNPARQMSIPTEKIPSTAQPSSERSNRTIGILCGIAVVVLFSSFTLVSKIGFASSLKLPDIAALRFSIGGLLLLPVLIHHGLSGVRWRDAISIAFLGGLGFALFAYTGFSLAPASHGAVLLHGTLPLFTFAVVRITSGTRATRGQVVGLATIFLGIFAMAWDSLIVADSRALLGDGSLLLASACWSAYGVLARRLRLNPAHAASIVAVFSMCFAIPIYIFIPGKTIFLVSLQELLFQGIFQGVLIGAVSIFIYTRAVAALGTVETALFTAAVPCVTTISAVFLLTELPSVVAMFGVAVVTLGMGISMKVSGGAKATR